MLKRRRRICAWVVCGAVVAILICTLAMFRRPLHSRLLFYSATREGLTEAEREVLLRRSVQLDPGFSAARCLLGLIIGGPAIEAFRAGDLGEARRIMDEAVRVSPDNPNLWRFLATVQDAQKDHASAVLSTKKALAVRILDTPDRRTYGVFYLIPRQEDLELELVGYALSAEDYVTAANAFQRFVQIGVTDDALQFRERWSEAGPKEQARIIMKRSGTTLSPESMASLEAACSAAAGTRVDGGR